MDKQTININKYNKETYGVIINDNNFENKTISVNKSNKLFKTFIVEVPIEYYYNRIFNYELNINL